MVDDDFKRARRSNRPEITLDQMGRGSLKPAPVSKDIAEESARQRAGFQPGWLVGLTRPRTA